MGQDIKVQGIVTEAYAEILSEEALAFLGKLHSKFNVTRKKLLASRELRQVEIDNGNFPDFLEETKEIREGTWSIDPIPSDLVDRRVEITGPVERKMVINALNSGAKVFMADFEDSNAPTWANVIDGQINLRDAVSKTISFTNPINKKRYRLNKVIATLIVRPRGWHLNDKNITVNGELISASLLDFGLYFFHNAKKLIKNGSGPYFYLPKLENHLEARLWNDVFVFAQEELGVDQGTIKATVLIETILASFEIDEILWELKNHSAGLNCGRWDYIFSFIKRFRNHPEFLFPDRASITMTADFMRAYSLLVIQTCHKRGAHAIGGMAAQIPIKGDLEANENAIEKVRNDKIREAKDGHDGTWVAHPALVSVAMDVFDEYMPMANQIHNLREDVTVSAKDLIAPFKGDITEEGLKVNIDVAIQYMASWLNGNGCVPIYNLMEDAATAEISRAQIWQWIRNDNAILKDGTPITAELYKSLLPVQLAHIRKMVGNEQYENGKYELAADLFNDLVTDDNFAEFLTLPAYKYIN
ncbi:MAG: malate synthase A [Bacteroidetes bacterium]|nr:MAG: malate synthase A [Bacteroidota bacterium]